MAASIAGVLLGFVGLLLIGSYVLGLMLEGVMASKGARGDASSLWVLGIGAGCIALSVLLFLS